MSNAQNGPRSNYLKLAQYISGKRAADRLTHALCILIQKNAAPDTAMSESGT